MMRRRRAADMGECPGHHLVIKEAVRVSRSLETYSSRGPRYASARGTCSIIFTSHGPVATVTVAVSKRLLGVQAPVTAVIAWMVPSTAVHRTASHKSDRAGSGAHTAASAASSASSFTMSKFRSNWLASSDWAISIRNIGNGPRRRAPPRVTSGVGGGESLGMARSVRTWYAAARRERVARGRETQKNGHGRGVTRASQDGRGGSQ